MQPQIYKTKIQKLPGTHWHQVIEKAYFQYKEIKRKTKRRPYIRSAYFKNEKIFLELFWNHLYEKANIRDKTRRLKYFPCAIELIKNSKLKPTTQISTEESNVHLHRFAGITPEGDTFFVQIKEERKRGQKWLVSMFPYD
ncbi:MAG: hypothetical protein A3B90_00240 [Candidatus Magasanikbacteria bacterium RIFCSPHIGHO2_02_FULL_41_13]|uniref:Uncharacterized protein n=1 Tax=Candidatus Magasanikbacteria bacterium RIFCSPHIGHO2_02_FULL_41_13 TaxID=1798676 RepID=A0A1F6M4A9_9BACT|nr:MAG: hypothetical protein A3B90_00240 [Candidatus Magasanikbacteria bacterium RIFCSPHIGHO2_02_FULL_41_13]